MYFALICVTLVLLFGVNRMERRLDGAVAEHNLRFTGQIKNAPPLVTFTTVALGSFRGLVADLLWLRAGSLQEKGSYFEMVQLARWITDLQPTFSGATAYLAWNMAYNISVTCSSFEDRFVDALGRKAPAQDAAGLFYAKVAVQHPRRVADEGEGKLGPLCGLCHHAGRGTHHAGQPHAAQSGQGLQVAGQVFPRDRVVKGRQEDHDKRVLPFAQLVKIIARCGGGIKGETGDGGAHQMF